MKYCTTRSATEATAMTCLKSWNRSVVNWTRKCNTIIHGDKDVIYELISTRDRMLDEIKLF